MGQVTIGSKTYEIYGTLAEALDWLDVNLAATAWQACDSDDKKKALVMTTRYFNRLRWKGVITDAVTPQPLAWPRDSTGVEGHVDGTTPQEILNGFWEMAGKIIEDPEQTNNRSTGSNVQRAKGGEAEVWFFRSTVDSESKFPVDVLDWISKYLAGGEGILSYDSGTFAGEFESLFDETPKHLQGFN